MAPAAMQGLYKIPRDRVVAVTSAIETLRTVPIPLGTKAIPNRSDTYRMIAAGHIVEYKLNHNKQWVLVLFIS